MKRFRRTLQNRREALRSVGQIGLAAILAGAAAPAPKETGLSFEGLLKGQPGFQPRTLAPLPFEEISGFLSKAQLARSYETYKDAFAKLIAAENSLAGAPRDATEGYAALRRQQMVSANAVLLHEFYFRNLSPAPTKLSGYVNGNMREHMGSFEAWRDDFTACARAAESWAVLVCDPYDDRWHNLPLGASDAGGMAGANPLVVCKMSEDAWSTDYEKREAYIAAFFDHLDWNAVAARYRAVDRK